MATAKKPAAKKPAAKKPAAKKPAAKKPAAKAAAASTTPTAAPAKAEPTKSVPTDLVHYYRLVFQVAPGGSRKAEFFVAGTIDEIKRAAMDDLGSGEGAYHAVFYGETIVLQCWEGTKKVSSIDLHPFITYRIEGIDHPITFPKPGDKPALDMDAPEYEELVMELAEEAIDVDVKIDWARVKLPKLKGRPLTKKEWAPFDEPGYPWAYGFKADWDMPLADP